jgi:hypothetical protein
MIQKLAVQKYGEMIIKVQELAKYLHNTEENEKICKLRLK